MVETTGTTAPEDGIRYKRVLLKVSGEALMGQRDYGLDPDMVNRIANEVKAVIALGVQVSLVIGGGNIFRGVKGAAGGMERASADYIGMLATVMNALSMQSALERMGVPTRVQSAIPMSSVCEPYIRRRDSSHGKGPGGDFRRRHRQPLLHHRHRRRAARVRNGL